VRSVLLEASPNQRHNLSPRRKSRNQIGGGSHGAVQIVEATLHQHRLRRANTIITEGIDVPSGWVPSNMCEPLDQDGANKFFQAGVRLPALIRVQPPQCYWKPDPNAAPGNPYRQWVLNGPFGASLGFQQIGVVGTGQAP
jgi:hypothetical protein